MKTPIKVQKIPYECEAIQWTGDNIEEMETFLLNKPTELWDVRTEGIIGEVCIGLFGFLLLRIPVKNDVFEVRKWDGYPKQREIEFTLIRPTKSFGKYTRRLRDEN